MVGQNAFTAGAKLCADIIFYWVFNLSCALSTRIFCKKTCTSLQYKIFMSFSFLFFSYHIIMSWAMGHGYHWTRLIYLSYITVCIYKVFWCASFFNQTLWFCLFARSSNKLFLHTLIVWSSENKIYFKIIQFSF